jgi:co-chaperonin GroES (HSP10)
MGDVVTLTSETAPLRTEAVGDRVFALPVKEEKLQKSTGGVELVGLIQQPKPGKVVSVGKRCKGDVQIGDIVYSTQRAQCWFEGQAIYVINEADIVGRLPAAKASS